MTFRSISPSFTQAKAARLLSPQLPSFATQNSSNFTRSSACHISEEVWSHFLRCQCLAHLPFTAVMLLQRAVLASLAPVLFVENRLCFLGPSSVACYLGDLKALQSRVLFEHGIHFNLRRSEDNHHWNTRFFNCEFLIGGDCFPVLC